MIQQGREREKWVSKNRIITWAPTEDKMLWYTPPACVPEGPTAYALLRICDIESCIDLFVTEEKNPAGFAKHKSSRPAYRWRWLGRDHHD